MNSLVFLVDDIKTKTQKTKLKMLNKNYKEIKTIKDVLKANNILGEIPDFHVLPKEDWKYIRACYLIDKITKAINGKWKPDFSDPNQKKFYCWFKYKPDSSGFVFDFAYDNSDYTILYCGARLCFETREQCEHFGTHFIDVINEFLLYVEKREIIFEKNMYKK
jgi:hypothetical protein